MYKYILVDFIEGFSDSLRLNLLLKPINEDPKLKKLIVKICKYNFLMHFLPIIFFKFIGSILKINLMTILDIINYPLNIFSLFFHLLHYFDLVNMMCTNNAKISKSVSLLDLLSITITMTIYQSVMYITTTLINLVFYERLYLFAILINFFILTIYHSFYCFNNLWQFKKIDMIYRIDIHEKLWPYYIGYGILPTIIYLYSSNSYIFGIYNLYMTLLISLPFLLKIKYPKNNMNYPPINLTIFSYITSFVFMISKKILSMVSKVSN